MRDSLLVGLGAAVGGNLRYWAGVLAVAKWGSGFPWGTLGVNVLGSMAIGAVVALAAAGEWPHGVRVLLVAGVLGGFTTLSAFSVETVSLVQEGRAGVALAYAAGSVLVSLLACWGGERAVVRILGLGP
ncbi:MAG: fluoride efflux transporter CrcB [Fimbriimonadaceae bacterium]